IPNVFHGSGVLVFAAGCGIMGLTAVVLDWILFTVRGRSIFGLSYGQHFGITFRLLFLWGVGAGVGGFLGSAANILQLSRGACIGAGVGWPLILPRLIDSFTREEHEDHQIPEGDNDGHA